ncbi:MAG: exopolysaccharide biosynthesis polyprenyl glycosylphosphotransferase [Cyclobacteriaceae bacterium]|nr:exopolysaccharide biosynthesis polyprenyl glycosylphosphotransferase [Cyclobacteriaceae bacterium]
MSFPLKLVFFISDLLFLNIAIILSYKGDNKFLINSNNNELYLLLFSNIGWVFLILVSSPYNLNKGWSLPKIFKSQVAFLFVHLLLVVSLIVFFEKNFSFTQILLIYLFFIPFFFTSKVLIVFLRRILAKEIQVRNYILIGRNQLSEEVRKFYLINQQEGYRFKGYFDFVSNSKLLDSLSEFCKGVEVHEIFYCADDPSPAQLKELVNFGLNSLIKIKLVSGRSSQSQTIQFEKYDQIPTFNSAILPLDEYQNQILKRTFDLIFSGLFLVLVFSWLYPLMSLIIKLDSKGPVLFVQTRGGLRNKHFGCYKFRTMNFVKEVEFIQAIKNDSRITKAGRFLRKSSIDELPQFINVFKGDMSLIGPRPHPIKLNEQFEPLISNMMARHYVKPGITGLAQCMGYRGETQTLADMENRVRLDRYYIENWTFWLDIKIIFLTVISLIRGSDKAY